MIKTSCTIFCDGCEKEIEQVVDWYNKPKLEIRGIRYDICDRCACLPLQTLSTTIQARERRKSSQA